MPRLAHLAAILVAVSIAVSIAARPFAPAQAVETLRGVDLFLGGGLSSDPNDDDSTGNIAFGAGYRGSRHWAVGLEGFRIKLSGSGMRILAGPYAKAYPLYNRFANPYGRAGIGIINFESDDAPDAPDIRFNLAPKLAVGLEIGLPALTLFAEVSDHFGVRFGDSSTFDTIQSITVGVSVHIFGRSGGGRSRSPRAGGGS